MADSYAKALTAYHAALELIDATSDPVSCATVLRDIGDVQSAQGRLDEAQEAYAGAVEYTSHHEGSERSLASMLLSLGRIRRKIGALNKDTLVSPDLGSDTQPPDE